MSKRQAGDQITKNRAEEDDWGRDTEEDPAQEASAEVLARRPIALPRSRRKGTDAQRSESPRPNPFASQTTATNATPAVNPFASLSNSNTNSSFAFGSSSSQNAFSFNARAASTPDSSHQLSEDSSSEEKPKNSARENKQESNDRQFDELLRYRSINVAFGEAIRQCLANDAFGDLTSICEEYKSHRNSSKAVPIAPAKSSSSTNIYPTFTTTSATKDSEATKDQAQTTTQEDSAESVAAEKEESAAPKFSFNPTAANFSFKPNNNSISNFSFGVSSTPEAVSNSAAESAPKFVFGQGSSAKDAEHEAGDNERTTDDQKNETSKEEMKNISDKDKKTSDLGSKDFSWTPDRGIKFGENSKTSETKTAAAPAFGFNNPLASPNQSSASATPPKPSFSFGGSGATGFSFGQAASLKPENDSKEPAATTNKVPAFSFGSSAPTFSFGQSTTPSFSFQAPKKDEIAQADKKDTNASAPAQEEAKEADNDGDAMPEEPRTNDALIAGPGVGEEDEDEVYNVPRAKLFKFDASPEKQANPWIDLGICVVRVLVHKETKKARIIARAEGAGALRLNARMYPHFKYTQEGKTNVKVYEMTAAQKNETYLIKIKDPAVAAEFTKILNEKKA